MMLKRRVCDQKKRGRRRTIVGRLDPRNALCEICVRGCLGLRIDDGMRRRRSEGELKIMNGVGQGVGGFGGFRRSLAWFFLILSMLYILYSSNLLLRNKSECPTVVADTTNVITVSTEEDLTNLVVKNVSSVKKEKSLAEEDKSESESESEAKMVGMTRRYDTEVKHIVFGIAASSSLWENRKQYISLWWKPGQTRGVVWLDKNVRTSRNDVLPPIKISGDTSKFKYTNRQGKRAALRISRVVSETLKLGLKDVRWFVMGDDDTVFIVDNVVRVLSKYDHNQFYYIGSSSESHVQNIFFSYGMAYGGGGFAISYPLAKELAKIQDGCIQRYPALYGSDDRIQACMAEIGVPLTKESGFHQYDVYGDLLGLLAAHPVTPLVSLHHLDVVEPVFPRMTQVRALKHLFESVKLDSASIMQQSICYDKRREWSISVSWGYVVQVLRGVVSPRELEMPSRTFLNWYRKADYTAYAFNTRPVNKHPCQKPYIYYMSTNKYDQNKKQTLGVYTRHKDRRPTCRWKMASPESIDNIIVLKKPDPLRWQKSPRRDCCKILPSSKRSTMYLRVGSCGEGEVSVL